MMIVVTRLKWSHTHTRNTAEKQTHIEICITWIDWWIDGLMEGKSTHMTELEEWSRANEGDINGARMQEREIYGEERVNSVR